MRKTGCRPSPPHIRARDAAVGSRPLRARLYPSLGGAVRLSNGATLEGWLGDVLDQGDTSACTGHAVGTGLWTATRNRIMGGLFPSQKGLYDDGRELEAPGAPLVDEGAVIDHVIDAVSLIGVRPMRGPTPDGRNSDCDPATINDPPTLEDLEEDRKSVILLGHPVGEQFEEDMVVSIDAGAPVVLAVPGGSDAWQGYGENGIDILDAAHVAGAPLDHAVLAYGYERTSKGLIWHLRNSWGTGWGRQGNILVTSKFISITGDRKALQVPS